jgi:hypothetical protein
VASAATRGRSERQRGRNGDERAAPGRGRGRNGEQGAGRCGQGGAEAVDLPEVGTIHHQRGRDRERERDDGDRVREGDARLAPLCVGALAVLGDAGEHGAERARCLADFDQLPIQRAELRRIAPEGDGQTLPADDLARETRSDARHPVTRAGAREHLERRCEMAARLAASSRADA